MTHDDPLASRARAALLARLGPDASGYSERRMFGGLCFLVRGNMCCGTLRGELIVRVEPAETEALSSRPHTRPMDFTGKPMRGFVVVEPEGLSRQKQLEEWIGLALERVRSLPPRSGKPPAREARGPGKSAASRRGAARKRRKG